MDVSGPVVYLPPQAFDRLNPSHVPIAIPLIAGPDPTAARKATLSSLDKLSAGSDAKGAASRGAVDLYA